MAGLEKAIEATVGRLATILLEKAPSAATTAYKNLELLIEKGLPSYLSAQNAKCEKIKTLINPNTPVLIDEIYEYPDFLLDYETVSADELLKVAYSDEKKLIITGDAGCGKSVFLKHAFRNVIRRGDSFYPVFLEFRDVELVSNNTDIYEEIFNSVYKFCENFKKSQFRFGLERGFFYILLDGFDELENDFRDVISKQIIEFSRKFPKCPIILSSRPSDDFGSWEGFHVTKLQPFSKEKAISFVRKIPFNEDRKSEFIDALDDRLYDEQVGFASNALLISMMLLTFDEYGDIPEKRHIFYEKCFNVLLREHDVSKGRYRRKFYTNLSYEALTELFMKFCVYSYLERIFRFDRKTFFSTIDDVIEDCHIECKNDEVALDFTESISMIQRDGDIFEFSHRSFQEYFYAKFVANDRNYSLKYKLLETHKGSVFDDIVDMVADMDRDYFEKNFLIPEIRRFLKELEGVDPQTEPFRVLTKLFSKAQRSEHNKKRPYATSYTYRTTKSSIVNAWLEQSIRIYPNLLGKVTEQLGEYDFTPFHDGIDKHLPDEKHRILMHHRNNQKLVEIGAGRIALRIIVSLEMLLASIEEKQHRSSSRLLSLMKSEKQKT